MEEVASQFTTVCWYGSGALGCFACQQTKQRKTCFATQDICQFLRKLAFFTLFHSPAHFVSGQFLATGRLHHKAKLLRIHQKMCPTTVCQDEENPILLCLCSLKFDAANNGTIFTKISGVWYGWTQVDWDPWMWQASSSFSSIYQRRDSIALARDSRAGCFAGFFAGDFQRCHWKLQSWALDAVGGSVEWFARWYWDALRGETMFYVEQYDSSSKTKANQTWRSEFNETPQWRHCRKSLLSHDTTAVKADSKSAWKTESDSVWRIFICESQPGTNNIPL